METLSLADIGLDAAAVGLANAWSEVKDFAERPAKAKGTVITDEGNGAEKSKNSSSPRNLSRSIHV